MRDAKPRKGLEPFKIAKCHKNSQHCAFKAQQSAFRQAIHLLRLAMRFKLNSQETTMPYDVSCTPLCSSAATLPASGKTIRWQNSTCLFVWMSVQLIQDCQTSVSFGERHPMPQR